MKLTEERQGVNTTVELQEQERFLSHKKKSSQFIVRIVCMFCIMYEPNTG